MAASDDFDTAMVAVVTAIGDADYATARKQIRIARAHLVRMPTSVSGEGTSLQQRQSSDLDALEASIVSAEKRANKTEIVSRWVPL